MTLKYPSQACYLAMSCNLNLISKLLTKLAIHYYYSHLTKTIAIAGRENLLTLVESLYGRVASLTGHTTSIPTNHRKPRNPASEMFWHPDRLDKYINVS